jgi:hypothetical protein
MGLFPCGFFLAGTARKDVYAEKTASLAGQALADAEIVSEVMKNVDRRLRPRQIPPDGDFAHTWFKAGGGILVDRGGFPSGHAIRASAMSSVIPARSPAFTTWHCSTVRGIIQKDRGTVFPDFKSRAFTERRNNYGCLPAVPGTHTSEGTAADLTGRSGIVFTGFRSCQPKPEPMHFILQSSHADREKACGFRPVPTSQEKRAGNRLLFRGILAPAQPVF